jgi:hypothetical protein
MRAQVVEDEDYPLRVVQADLGGLRASWYGSLQSLADQGVVAR